MISNQAVIKKYAFILIAIVGLFGMFEIDLGVLEPQLVEKLSTRLATFRRLGSRGTWFVLGSRTNHLPDQDCDDENP